MFEATKLKLFRSVIIKSFNERNIKMDVKKTKLF